MEVGVVMVEEGEKGEKDEKGGKDEIEVCDSARCGDGTDVRMLVYVIVARYM